MRLRSAAIALIAFVALSTDRAAAASLFVEDGFPMLPQVAVFGLRGSTVDGAAYGAGGRVEFVFVGDSKGKHVQGAFFATRMDLELGYAGTLLAEIGLGVGGGYVSPQGWGVAAWYVPLERRTFASMAFIGSGLGVGANYKGFSARLVHDGEGLFTGAVTPAAAFNATWAELRVDFESPFDAKRPLAVGFRHSWLDRSDVSHSEDRLWLGLSL